MKRDESHDVSTTEVRNKGVIPIGVSANYLHADVPSSCILDSHVCVYISLDSHVNDSEEDHDIPFMTTVFALDVRVYELRCPPRTRLSWSIRPDHFKAPLTPTKMTAPPTTRDAKLSVSLIPRMAPPPVRANNSDSDLCTVRTAGANLSTVQHRETNHLSNDAPPETRSEHESTRPFPLPYDIVEATIAHLAHNLGALKTCSLTCQSWYTAAVPHLHHTLTLTGDGPDTDRGRLKPLSKLHGLGLTHLVKVI